MAIFFDCACGQKLSCPDGSEGRKVKCPKCQAVATVPSLASAAAGAQTPQEPQQSAKPMPARQQTLPPPLAQDSFATGEQKTTCPFCKAQIASTAHKCPHCREWIGGSAPGTPPSTLPGMPPMDAQRAVELEGARKNATVALICAIGGIFCCGILSIVGLVLGYSSRKVFDRYSETDGRGNASAAIIIGWIMLAVSVVSTAIWIFVVIASMAAQG
jgi:hypothetical protein